MDTDSFLQCLTYIQSSSVSKSESILGKVVPSLAGVFVGFVINYAYSSLKDRKLRENRVQVCLENIESIRADLKQALGQIAVLFKWLEEGGVTPGTRFPSSVNVLFIEKHFIEVADQFTKEQRRWTQQVLMHLEFINKKLIEVKKPDEDLFLYSKSLLNLNVSCMVAWKLCGYIQNNKESEMLDSAILTGCGLASEDVNRYFLLHENATKNNETLGLKWPKD